MPNILFEKLTKTLGKGCNKNKYFVTTLAVWLVLKILTYFFQEIEPACDKKYKKFME